MPAPVIIEDYDPAWPGIFEREKELIIERIGHRLLRVEHMGSTAVPGLGAKPIIDILAAVPELGPAPDYAEPLEPLGYVWIENAGFEDAHSLSRRAETSPGSLPVHLFLTEMDSWFWRRHLVFRDQLRARPETAAAYEALKRDLAQKFRHDRPAYVEGKTGFIEGVVRQARGEA
jgi:GrpB-like predicted nucleotidyltransferase (UPF0157 family)